MKALSAALVSLLLLSACGASYLRTDDIYEEQAGFAIDEEAEIRDTTDNRKVMDVLITYRNAMVRKDVGALRRLISERYYDNGGTTDTTRDDYAAEALPEIFELLAQRADQIKYDVVVKNLEVKEGVAFVDYEYQYAYQYSVGDQPTWDAGLDVNRLELESEDGEWKIVSGL